jgi:hypothetical protein
MGVCSGLGSVVNQNGNESECCTRYASWTTGVLHTVVMVSLAGVRNKCHGV